MAKDADELKKEIAQKNYIIDSLNDTEKSNKDKIRKLKVELDRLLYLYYKSLKYKCSSPEIFLL